MVIFQLVLLQPMYEAYKVSSVEDVSNTIVESLDNDNLDDVIFQTERESDTCVRIINSNEYVDNFGFDEPRGCYLYRLPPDQINSFIQSAEQSDDGTYLVQDFIEPKGPREDDNLKNIIYTRIVDDSTTVMVYSAITPVNATTNTLTSQLIYIGICVILGILILTWLLNKEIAKPLSSINEAAKELPNGKYNYDANTNRYQEATELNNTLQNAAESIKQADKAKRDLLANVSHDLRTPLTMITGYGEMMLDLPEEKSDENIEVIINESKRLNALVNDILDLSRLQENQIQLNKEVFNLTELIEEEMKKYDVYRSIEGFTFDEELVDDVYINADKERIRQVFNNFMINAINYSTDDKKVVVRETINDDKVRIEVQDFGEGIAEDDLKNIWERYFKVDKEHKRAASGSGIGLSIVRSILELHEATYGVDSKLNEGSTFYFEFPIVKK